MTSLLSEYIIISPLAMAEARRTEKKIFRDRLAPPPTPLSQGLNDRAPLLPEGLDPLLPCKGIQDRLDPGFHSMTSITSGFQYWSRTWILDSSRYCNSRFLVPRAVFRIPKPRNPDFTCQNSWIPDFARKEWLVYLSSCCCYCCYLTSQRRWYQFSMKK